MATITFTGYVNDTDNKYGVQVVCRSEPDITTNTSKVTVDVIALHPRIDISTRTVKVNVAGTPHNFTSKAISTTGPTNVGSVTVQIAHTSDGSQSVDIVVQFPFDLKSNNYGRVGTATVSGTFELDDIPRVSGIASMTEAVDVTGENSWTVTMTKYVDTFRHIATLTFGGEEIRTDVFDTEISVLIPLQWLNLIPTQAESSATASIQTYTDETCTVAVGGPTVKSFTIRVPDDSEPTLSPGWAVVSVLNEGAAEGMTRYVQGYSRAQAAFDDARITARYGASIARVELMFDGAVCDNNTTPVLTRSGSNAVTCVVTDSRGKQSGETFEIHVESYSKPTLTGISINRCDQYGNENEDGTSLYFKVTCRFSECGGENTIDIGAAWKKVENNTWGSAVSIANGVGSVLGTGQISITSSYDARIVAVDRMGNAVAFTTRISTANVAFHLHDGGNGGAFGKYAEYDNLLDCAWDMLVRGDMEVNGVVNAGGGIFGADGYRIDKAVQRQNLALMTGWAAYNAESTPRITRAGALVFLDGMATNTAALAADFTSQIATLPEWAKPVIDVHVIQQGSERAIFWLRVHNTGEVNIMRYRTEEGYTAPAADSQFPLSMCWIAADAVE